MGAIWTHGVWTVKRGREEEFVHGWFELANVGAGLGGGEPTLLRDRERSNVFLSFGPWPDLEAIERFREAIRPRIAVLNELLESLELFTLDEVQASG
jgi:hypothetical protein